MDRSIIMVAYDDLLNVQRYRDKFGVELHIPNFDRLAAMGTSFENAFASTAVCNPSRTSALTGLSPFQTGVHMTTQEQWNDQFAPRENVVAMMQDAGYRTMGVGKVFHNSNNAYLADLFNGFYDDFSRDVARLSLSPGRIAEPIPNGTPMTDDLSTDWAVERITEHETDDDPMFLTLGLIRPHRPFLAPQEYFDLYPAEDIVLPADPDGDLSDVAEFYKKFRLLTNYDAYLEGNGLDVEFVQGYLASLSYADAKLGEILDAIEANAALDDATLIVWSDHGYELGEKRTWNKFTLWEESANIPFVIVDPDLTAGGVVSTPVSLLDLAPTLLDLAGATPTAAMPGQSLMDIAADPGAHAGRVAVTSMIGSVSLRTETHRLIHYNDGSVELYDMVTDPEQRTNLAGDAASAALIETLTTRLVTELAAQGATFDPDAATLTGTSADDVLLVTGAQAAAGGGGDDTYFVADGASVTETAGEGFDTVYFADFDFSIPDHVEHVRNHMFSNNVTYVVTGNAEDNEILIFNARGDVSGGAGDDSISGSTARDILDGGPGRDFIQTASGTLNTLIGGHGGDAIIGGKRTDLIHGDLLAGVDGGSAADILIGDPGLILRDGDVVLVDGTVVELNGDILPANRVAAFVDAGSLTRDGASLEAPAIADALSRLIDGAGPRLVLDRRQGEDDTIFAGRGDDLVLALGGNDTVDAGSGHDRVFGDTGNDSIDGRGGDDMLDDWSGDDRMAGGSGDDTILSGAGDDTLLGNADNDSLYAGAGEDVLQGGVGHDLLIANAGNDGLAGDAGNDTLFGGSGADSLFGGAGNDTLAGDAGNDWLDGTSGHDTLTGGQGQDVFVFGAFAGSAVVTDFMHGVDKIEIAPGSGLDDLSISAILSGHLEQDGSDVILSGGVFEMRLTATALLQFDDDSFSCNELAC